MSPLTGSAAQSPLPSPPSKTQSSEILATAFNETVVYISEPCSLHLTDSGGLPELPLDERQITESTSCVVNIEPEKKPEKFQENDILLVYPCTSRGRTNLDLSVNPAEMKCRLSHHIREIMEYRFLKGLRKTDYTSAEINSLADSILTRLPAELTEFLNQDYPDEKLFSPEEYQALARFHGAIILFKDFEYKFTDSIFKYGFTAPTDKELEEFNDFFIKECLPLRDGWSEDDLEFIESWLNSELETWRYHDSNKMKHYIKACHYGILKAGCVSVCGKCKYTVIENWEAYKSIKNLESQLAKLP